KNEKEAIPSNFLYEFKLGSKAAETNRKINETFGPETTNEWIVQRWFQKFRNGKIFNNQAAAKTAFREFVDSRTPEFYANGIKELVSC
ncbi:SETMR methyltransferase, partial [Acromyrmex insinuator]